MGEIIKGSVTLSAVRMCYAADPCGLLQSGVHVTECRRQQHDLDSDAVAHQVRPHDAPDAEDVERAVLNKGKRGERPVEQPE